MPSYARHVDINICTHSLDKKRAMINGANIRYKYILTCGGTYALIGKRSAELAREIPPLIPPLTAGNIPSPRLGIYPKVSSW